MNLPNGHKNLLFRVMKFFPSGLSLCIFIVFLIFPTLLPLDAQGIENLSVSNQKDNIQRIYSAKIASPLELINGKEYEPYYLRSVVKPLLFPGKPRTAKLFTGNRVYDDLTLQYDTFLDEVIYTDTGRMVNSRFPQIALNKDIARTFILNFANDTMTFRFFKKDDTLPVEGYYEIAYEGITRFFIKHTSKYYERQGVVNYKYIPRNFMSNGGKFLVIRTKKDLMNLLGGKAETVKGYMRSERIKIRKADKDQIIHILKFYDSISKTQG
jgi:hypothetical protein